MQRLKMRSFKDDGQVATLNAWADNVNIAIEAQNKGVKTAQTSAGIAAVVTASATGPFPANEVYATPNGSGGELSVRPLVGADLPDPTTTTLGGVEAINPVAHEWIYEIDGTGKPHLSQPAFTDISGNLALSQLPTAGVSAGPYTVITSITVTNGLITAITGS